MRLAHPTIRETSVDGSRRSMVTISLVFNVLKNSGYNFEHNCGHGKQHVASILASVALLSS